MNPRLRSPLLVLLALAAVLMLPGCGNKGDLVRPGPPPAAAAR